MTASSATAHEFFVDTWNVYHKLVSSNYMFHREIYADVERLLHDAFDRAVSLLDLGCGDTAHILPILRKLEVSSYRGVDLSDAALALAAQNLRGLPFQVELNNADLLEYLARDSQTYDVIFSSFALHHLMPEQKGDFFRHASARLNPGGMLLLIDVMREEHQDLPTYLDAYCSVMKKEWRALDPLELDYAVTHVRNYDRPETPGLLIAMAERAELPDFRPVSRYGYHHVLGFKAKR